MKPIYRQAINAFILDCETLLSPVLLDPPSQQKKATLSNCTCGSLRLSMVRTSGADESPSASGFRQSRPCSVFGYIQCLHE